MLWETILVKLSPALGALLLLSPSSPPPAVAVGVAMTVVKLRWGRPARGGLLWGLLLPQPLGEQTAGPGGALRGAAGCC